MIIGYKIGAQDDGSYMLGTKTYKPHPQESASDWLFADGITTHPAICSQCGRKIDKYFIDPTFKVQKRNRDLSCTFDGYLLCSRRFKDFCVRIFQNNHDFIELPNDSDFFWLNPENIVHFDIERRKTRFESFCPKCNHYSSIAGSKPVYLKNPAAIHRDGFYKTDIEFGSGFEQHSIVIIGISVFDAIKSEKFKGIEIEKVEESPPVGGECV